MEASYFGMGDTLSRGQKFEFEAMRILIREGYDPVRASEEDNIYRHVDFWAVGKDGKSYGFDAKAMKSLNRGEAPQDEWTFVEWRGVTGYPGWLVEGCDILVFERSESVVLVRRLDLLSFCKKSTVMDRRVSRASESKYCIYSRSGRKDAISLFRFDDLDIPTKVFRKDE